MARCTTSTESSMSPTLTHHDDAKTKEETMPFEPPESSSQAESPIKVSVPSVQLSRKDLIISTLQFANQEKPGLSDRGMHMAKDNLSQSFGCRRRLHRRIPRCRCGRNGLLHAPLGDDSRRKRAMERNGGGDDCGVMARTVEERGDPAGVFAAEAVVRMTSDE